MGSSKKSWRALYEVASSQQGFFTSQQAKLAGYRDSLHIYHVRNGDWEKAVRGIYRLVHFPTAAWPELTIYWLWTRGRDDIPKGVFSHETALQIHGELPRKAGPLHLTVPMDFRKGSEIPRAVLLHKVALRPEDIVQKEGFAVTTMDRTLRDTGKKPRKKPASAPSPRVKKEAQPAPKNPPEVPTHDDWAVWE